MSEARLVTSEEAQLIATEVREDFRAAFAKTQKLAAELDELGRLQSGPGQSPPPTGATALRVVKLK